MLDDDDDDDHHSGAAAQRPTAKRPLPLFRHEPDSHTTAASAATITTAASSSSSSARKQVESTQQQALLEEETIFDYDAVYDHIKAAERKQLMHREGITQRKEVCCGSNGGGRGRGGRGVISSFPRYPFHHAHARTHS